MVNRCQKQAKYYCYLNTAVVIQLYIHTYYLLLVKWHMDEWKNKTLKTKQTSIYLLKISFFLYSNARAIQRAGETEKNRELLRPWLHFPNVYWPTTRAVPGLKPGTLLSYMGCRDPITPVIFCCLLRYFSRKLDKQNSQLVSQHSNIRYGVQVVT